MIGSLFFVILTSLKLLPFENKNKSHFILYSAHLIVTLAIAELTSVRKRKEKQAFLLLFLSLNRNFATQ
jgi:hypothetical protein